MLDLLNCGDAVSRGVDIRWVGLVEGAAVGTADGVGGGKDAGDWGGAVGFLGGGRGLPISGEIVIRVCWLGLCE